MKITEDRPREPGSLNGHVPSRRLASENPNTIEFVLIDIFEPANPAHPYDALKLTPEATARLRHPDAPFEIDRKLFTQFVGRADGLGKVQSFAEQATGRDPTRAWKRRTTAAIVDCVQKSNAWLQIQQSRLEEEQNSYPRVRHIRRARFSDDKQKTPNAARRADRFELRFSQILFFSMLAAESIQATNLIMNSSMAAGDHWLSAASMGVPAVIGLYVALKARPMDLRHSERPGYFSRLTQYGLYFAAIVIALFASALGDSSGGSLFTGGQGPSPFMMKLFSGAVMFSLALAACSLNRMINRNLELIYEWIPVTNPSYADCDRRLLKIHANKQANSTLAQAMIAIRDSLDGERADFIARCQNEYVTLVRQWESGNAKALSDISPE